MTAPSPDTLADDEAGTGLPDEQVEPWTSDAALTLEDARVWTGRRGATLVMLLGEVGTGKSTFLVELWTELLMRGAVGEVMFAGSTTALAFEQRAFESRLESGGSSPDTRRTQQADDGFLHLRLLRTDARLVETLLADVTGEHFTRIREGTPIDAELPWDHRVDRYIVLVDGAAYSGASTREVALTRSKRLLHALRESRNVAASSRIAVVLTKEDVLSQVDSQIYRKAEASLLALARQVDSTASAWRIAARPSDHSEPRGLAPLLSWLCSDDRSVERPPVTPIRGVRMMARFRA